MISTKACKNDRWRTDSMFDELLKTKQALDNDHYGIYQNKAKFSFA